MGDEQADELRKLLPILKSLAEGQVKSAGVEKIVPDWLKWAGTLLISAILFGAAWTNARRDIEDVKHSAITAGNATKTLAAELAETNRKIDLKNKEANDRLNDFAIKNASRIRKIERKLDLPDGD